MFPRNFEILELKSIDTHMKRASKRLIRPLFFLFFTIILLLYGCATFQAPKPGITSIDQFPDFIVADGPNIDPASVDSDLPDVDVLALNEDMKRILDESVKAKGYRQRLDALMDIIDQNIKFDTIEDQYGTKTAIETFESRSGNCLSFSNLFVAMARYLGLRSSFQELPTAPNWIRDGEVLLFTRHIGASVDIGVPAQYMVNLINESGNIKILLNSINRWEYLFVPVPTTYLRHSQNMLSNRSITDRRAFAQYYNNIGSQHLVEDNTTDAFRYFVKAINVDPKLDFVWSNLGVIYSRNNQSAAAENAYLQALSVNRDIDLNTMTVMSNLARLYARQGKMEEADLYEKRVRSYRNMNPYYHYSIGEIAFYDGHYSESVEHYEEAIKRKSDDHQFYYALALAYLKLGEMDKAEKSMNKAISYAGNKQIEDYYEESWKKLSEDAAARTELL